MSDRRPMAVIEVAQKVNCTECGGVMYIAPWHHIYPDHPGFKHVTCPTKKEET